ncbi:hypothetical protein FB451DRAFT_1180888 [Mycena latifolia]|nr:hypothetical protein FB451DRAFT_1180888 [Mycena latifolia]
MTGSYDFHEIREKLKSRKNMFTGRDICCVQVTPYLEDKLATNGLDIFFTTTKANKQLVKSTPNDKRPGVGVTSLTTVLAKKCLGGSENAKAKHAIWCLILHAFIRRNDDLRTAVVDDKTVPEEQFGNDDDEFPVSIVPAKLNNTGAVVVQASDGKIVQDFWCRLTSLWCCQNKDLGTPDLKSEPWTRFINDYVKEEQQLFPSDVLTLIIGSGSAAAAATTATASVPPASGRLSGTSSTGTLFRLPLTPNAGNSHPAASPFGGFPGQTIPSLDHLMNTPTNFVRSGSSSTSGLRLPPFNAAFEGRAEGSGSSMSPWCMHQQACAASLDPKCPNAAHRFYAVVTEIPEYQCCLTPSVRPCIIAFRIFLMGFRSSVLIAPLANHSTTEVGISTLEIPAPPVPSADLFPPEHAYSDSGQEKMTRH